MKIKKYQLFLAISLPIQVIIIHFVSKCSEGIERYYSNGIYPIISKILRAIFGWLPFSFGDTLAIFLIILVIKGSYQLFKSKFKIWKEQVLKLTSILAILYFCFYAFWGLNYFREPLGKKLRLQEATYNNEKLIATTIIIIDSINSLQIKLAQNDSVIVSIPYTAKDIYIKAVDGYEKLQVKNPDFHYEKPSVKSSLVSLLQSYNGTSGYINPITNEAQINNQIPKTGMPATTCHEIAHQIGWAAENEANFLGFLAAIYNDDKYFKYSGYRMALNYCLREIRKRDINLYKQVLTEINKGVLKDYKATYLHWKKFENPIEPYIKKGYNSYLKANNQQKGIDSYNYVVDLLISFHQSTHNL